MGLVVAAVITLAAMPFPLYFVPEDYNVLDDGGPSETWFELLTQIETPINMIAPALMILLAVAAVAVGVTALATGRAGVGFGGVAVGVVAALGAGIPGFIAFLFGVDYGGPQFVGLGAWILLPAAALYFAAAVTALVGAVKRGRQ